MQARPRIVCALLLAVASCKRGEPPTPPGVVASVAPMPGPVVSSPVATTSDAGEAGDGASSAAKVDPGPDPGTLPQTRDKPEASGAAFEARTAALWQGIVKDDADRALPFFFPVTAYEQVKAISHPAADWRRRLFAAYKRDIHALHKRLGEHAESAKFLRIEVPDDRARWIEPNEESNKIGYYRVYGTRLVYEVDGKERTFEVSSLISWRGQWYVVHLTGFK